MVTFYQRYYGFLCLLLSFFFLITVVVATDFFNWLFRLKAGSNYTFNYSLCIYLLLYFFVFALKNTYSIQVLTYIMLRFTFSYDSL